MSPAAGPPIATLAAVVEQLCAVTGAYALAAELPATVHEDIALIRAQAERARATVRTLDGPAAHERRREELHRLNNVLTGIISLAALCVEDAAQMRELVAQLRETERLARVSAQAIRDLGHAT